MTKSFTLVGNYGVGTRIYMAPEMILAQNGSVEAAMESMQSDVWSLGLMFFDLLPVVPSRTYTWSKIADAIFRRARRDLGLFAMIVAGLDCRKYLIFPDGTEQVWQDLVCACLVARPDGRITILRIVDVLKKVSSRKQEGAPLVFPSDSIMHFTQLDPALVEQVAEEFRTLKRELGEQQK